MVSSKQILQPLEKCFKGKIFRITGKRMKQLGVEVKKDENTGTHIYLRRIHFDIWQN